MPLLEVLDEDAGIGFGGPQGLAGEMAPLLDGLAFPGAEPILGLASGGRDAYLVSRLLELGAAVEWELSDADLEALENPAPPKLPDAFAGLAVVAGTGPQALDQGDFKVLLEACHGPSGARLLGRFCHGDGQLAEAVREHLRAEERLRPGVVFGEVVHLPEGRMGNVLCRPVLRSFEIPFLGLGGAPEQDRIAPGDLQVAVREGRVVVRSLRLGREVLPRLTSAHNYGRGLGVYRFLGALQDQDGCVGGWSWGALEMLPFLPRVRRGQHVLQRARWIIRREEFTDILHAPLEQACAACGRWRARRGLPDRSGPSRPDPSGCI